MNENECLWDRRMLALQVFSKYAHRVDDGDLEGWSHLFSDNAVFRSRTRRLEGRDAILAYIRQSRRDGEESTARHIVTNVEVQEGDDPTQAQLRADFLHMRRRESEVFVEMVGTYRSSIQWEGDHWLIADHEVSFLYEGTS